VTVAKRSFIGIVEAGEALIKKAIDAMRELRAAEAANASAEEVERLRLIADSLYQAVIDFQLIEAKQAPDTIH
jgi:DNA-binding transcriptional LysR family regulator